MAEPGTHHERLMHHLRRSTSLLATQAKENQVAMAAALEQHNKVASELLAKEGVTDAS